MYFGKSELLDLSKQLSLKITLYEVKIFSEGYTFLVILKFWSTMFVFIDSLHRCAGTHKNTENSVKHLGSYQILPFILVRKKIIQKV